MKENPQKPPRYKEDNSIYFLTFCTFKRLPLLHVPGIPEFLIEELKFYERKIQKLIAYTIMPDHIHLIVEVKTVQSLSNFLRDFKKFTSREISNRSSRSPNGANNQPNDINTSPNGANNQPNNDNKPNRIWQPGTMDHCIRMSWDGKDYSHHISYLFYNSHKHLGIAPKDFPYHNFMEFVQAGYFDKDFCSWDEKAGEQFQMYE
ncbi:MAG: hypothetical protein EPO24_16325 [Bacteroidetes bacterium]|nr:MAG: hypothetical protein EPO24_16325 [Bacteroidota bacterium]